MSVAAFFKIIEKLEHGKMAQWLLAHTDVLLIRGLELVSAPTSGALKATFHSNSSLLYSESTYTHMSI